jgi:hypothetical protein
MVSYIFPHPYACKKAFGSQQKQEQNLTQKSATPRLRDHCVHPEPKIFRNSETGQKKAYFWGTLEN